jgi:predicted unusual protein kinase regulating ubiquinone biosynthesis (AarF/ABC1/UbiB family)
VGARFERTRRALHVLRIARHSGGRRVLSELGVVGRRDATPDGARRFREALEELGTTYIKLGQLLSSRPDLLPDVYIDELSRLVDEVPPAPFAAVKAVIDEDLGAEAFVRIDPEPLATASIAQTHRALLATGREVVVKVRRPGIEEEVLLDLALLRTGARVAARRSETAELLQLEALADELEVHLREELDFLEEAHNAELIGRVVERFPSLVVPAVVRPHVSERALVLDYVEGEKIDVRHGLDPDRAAALARELFRAYVFQVVVEGVYHADPHKGNVLLMPDGRLALLDFGLLGRLDDDTRRGLALLLLAIAQNRADDVADLMIDLSLTRIDTDEAGFVHAVRRVLPRYHWRPLSGIRTGEALANLQRLALDHGIRLPTSFALVGKTLAQADEIARTLDPALDPVELIREQSFHIVGTEIRHRLEPSALLAFLAPQVDELAKLPRRVGHVVERLETGTLKVGVVPTDLRDLEHMIRSASNRLGMALIIVGLLLSSALMARVNHVVSLAGFSLAVAIGLYMIWKIIRTPGEL